MRLALLLLSASLCWGNLFAQHSQEIVVLTPKDFNKRELLRGDLNVICNFHSPSCGHCVAQAPTYIKFASLVFNARASLVVAAVDCDAFRDVCSEFRIAGTPTFKLFAAGRGLLDLSTRVGGSLKDLVDASNKHLGTRLDMSMARAAPSSNNRKDVHMLSQTTLGSEKLAKQSPKSRVLHDAALSIRYSLEKGVFLGRFELSPVEYKALVDWLDVLQQLYPCAIGRWKLSLLRQQVLVSHHESGNKLTSENFDRLLANWGFANQGYTWQYCGQPSELGDGTGYTCGLWLLFHILATSSTSASTFTSSSTQLQLSLALHGFVRHFFSCLDCRDNFLLHNPEPFQPSPENEFAMWLWKEHNFVNRRLNRENANVQHFDGFPTREMCPSCYREGGEEFDEQVVQRFLRHAFSSFSNTEAISWLREAESEHERRRALDFSTLAIVLVLVTALLLLVGLTVVDYYYGKTKPKKLNV
ncbi:hypothetical protein BASA81_007964 [Batrachochytrium salamandrivorans]|nr:hypothetical protein BASA81_007964 [Batrachochytrium salamandrivorans]